MYKSHHSMISFFILTDKLADIDSDFVIPKKDIECSFTSLTNEIFIIKER